jgi:hypothetical protein
MRKFLLHLSFLAMPVIAQTPYLQWEKSVNGQLSGYENTQNAWQDPSGNFLIIGTSEYDAFVQKVDNNGNQLLRIKWDGPQRNNDIGISARSDAAGNIYLGGLTIYGSWQLPFVAKYDANGVKLWEYVQTNVTMSGTVTAMTLDSYTSPTSLYITGSKNDSSAVVRLDAVTGMPVWEKTLWPHGKMNDIDIDNNGHPLVCGYHAFTGNDPDFYAAVLNASTGYPLRGFWKDGLAADSVTDPNSYFDQAYKIKAGPSGTFAVMGIVYDVASSGSVFVAKFGSIGNLPTWTYSYNSPNHTGGNGVRLLTDASFSNFYYLAGAMSTGGNYYKYTIAGKVDNTGAAIWEKEYFINGTSLQANDMALDANNNAHIISDAGYPGDIYYKKLASSNGSIISSLQYDNMRNGGNAYDYSTNIFLDNTGHPFIFGSSNALTFTNDDILMVALNTNATLNWDLTIDFFVNAPNNTFNVQTMPAASGVNDQIITCGKVINNITSSDVAITSFSESGSINWQALFDDNNGGDQVIGFEKSYSNNLFLCSYNNSNSKTSITEFYSNGTTNSTNQPNWAFYPDCFKIDSAENSFVCGGEFGYSDFGVGIFLRNNGNVLTNTLTVAANIQTTPYSIATDNSNIYVGGTIINDGVNPQISHLYVQKYDLGANKLWSAMITGFDSTSYPFSLDKIVYDRATDAVYLVGKGASVGSPVVQTILARINSNGSIVWVRKENASGQRNQYLSDITVANGKIYITGYANMASTPNDNLMLTEEWDINGNKQWEYVFDKPNTDERGISIVLNAAGEVFVGGKVNENVSVQGSSDMLLVKLNSAGNLIWEREYDGGGQDVCANIALSTTNTVNPRVYMCGNTQSPRGPNYDIGTIKYCDLPVATVSYSGPTSICQNSSMTLGSTGVNGGGTIMWSNGSSSPATTVNTSGGYYFTYSEYDGCSENSDTVTVNIKGAPAPVQICMVTVDDSSKHNLIIWDKTAATPDVIGFNIYREDLTNIYHQIGSVPYSSLSEFVDLDPTANPNANTKRYKITTVDSCGNESAKSNYHNTIYIVSNGSGQFSWNQLYTIENSPNPVVQYILLRDDYSLNNWHAIDSTAGTQFNINDVSFGTFQPTASWRVVTQWNISCTPTSRLGGNSIMSTIVRSKSNITNNRVTGIGSLNSNSVSVYPNPASNMLHVSVPASRNTTIKLLSLVGEELVAQETSDTSVQFDISKFAAGVYLLEVSNESGKFIQRIVKE